MQRSTHCQIIFSSDINKNLNLEREYVLTFSLDIICSQERTVFQEQSSKKCNHRGTDNVQGPISVHIFLKPNGGYCVYYPSNIFTPGDLFSNFKKVRVILLAFKILLVSSKCSIQIKNLLRLETKPANVNDKARKLGNITWYSPVLAASCDAFRPTMCTIFDGL